MEYKNHEDQPIYCFKLDEATGELKRYTVTKYNKVCTSEWMQKYVYHFDGRDIEVSERFYTLRDMKLNRFVGNKLFTFDYDMNNARDAIRQTLEEEEDTAMAKYRLAESKLKRFIRANPRN